MEEKSERVDGAMLIVKQAQFEERFYVPQEEWLTGDGWLSSFCKTYKIKECRRHGEAGSVNIEVVAAECTHVQASLAKFPPKDRLNFNEMSLFALYIVIYI
jgi:hypothetical protein